MGTLIIVTMTIIGEIVMITKVVVKSSEEHNMSNVKIIYQQTSSQSLEMR